GRDWLFWVLALGGIVFFVTSAGQGDPLNFGVAVWPVTSHMLAATGLFASVLTLLLVLLLGEPVWRERDAQVAPLIDTSNTPN
ncbi:MAG: hypothetical protein JOZ87_19580, partial [Chloroflexi bacterium]|nr:hypothetical protein [Chloroflexota bacterium]